MTDFVLDVRNLQVEFLSEEKRNIAVDGISFQLKPGQKLGIVGESGSGKSVTSLAMMGLVGNPGKITGGEIWYRDRDEPNSVDLIKVSEEKRRKYRGNRVAMIFQEPMSALNPVYNIGFQITEAIRLHQKVSNSEARRQAIARLQEVQLLDSDDRLRQKYQTEIKQQDNRQSASDSEVDRYINQQKQAVLKRYPHELSGGQQQRVTIAMAISCNPKILIADEPTTALDVTVQASILKLLQQLCGKRGMSLIFITHDLGVIAELVDTVAVMYRGKIVECGAIRDIFTNPQHPYTKGLLACRPRLDRHLRTLPTISDFMDVSYDESGEVVIKEKNDLISEEKQIEITLADREARLSQLLADRPLISVKNLHVGFPQKKTFGRDRNYFMAVNNVSFDVYPGETLGLVGESGCGKSTLARTILRLVPSRQGEIIFRGENIASLKTGDKKLRNLRREMQIVFQNPYNSLNPRMTVGRAIAEPMVVHNTGGTGQKRQERVAYLLDRVGLNPNLINRYPHEFSGGQRQRICIARALALNPQFIICDESVSALDVSVQAQVLNLLKELQEEFGLTYIFISHDLSVVKFMSDRIMVMNQGKIEELDAAEKVYRSPQKEYTRQLIASIPKGEIGNRE